MSIRIPGVLVAAAGLAVSLPAMAQSIPWLTAVNGNWNDATKWTGGNVPDAMGETAVLGLTGAYTVTQNVDNLMIDGIDITNVDAVLNVGARTTMLHGAGLFNSGTVTNHTGTGTLSGPISNGATGRINVNSGTALNIDTDLVNDGLFTVNASGGASTTTLTIQSPLTISGSGALELNGVTSRAQVIATGSGALTNGATHTIRGFGQITAPMTNNGTVSATVAGQSLFLSSSPKTNNGLMRGAGGTLSINGITISQGAGGIVRGEGTLVALTGATISGGSIDSTAGGIVRSISGTNTLLDVDSTADVEVGAATVLALGGGFYTNDGTLVVNPTGSLSTTTLRIDGPLTVDGTGEIRLGQTSARAQITASVDGVLTLGAGQLVHGRGVIAVPTTNNGTISADVPGNALQINTGNKSNNGVMEAAGGTLEVSGVTITQGASGEVIADGSNVDLSNATIVSGSLLSANGGFVRMTGGTSTFDAVDSDADVQILGATALNLTGGTFTNEGTVTVNPTGSASTTTLRATTPLVIDGTGEITLGNTTSRAQIVSDPGASIDFGPNQIVRGVGQIDALAHNEGEIVADSAVGVLDLNTNNKSNAGLMRAQGSGTLTITGISILQTESGEIVADSANVLLGAATVVGGTIGSNGDGIVRQSSGISHFQSVVAFGSIEVTGGTTLTLHGSVVNNASIVVNPTGSASTTSLAVEGVVTLSGTGEIVLNNTTSRARISPGSGANLTLGPGQTVRGIGQFAMPVTIEGAVAPGLSVGTLTVAAAATTLTWQPGSVLDVELGSASSFDKISGGSHTINGGTVNVTLTGGYTPALFDTHAIIDGASGSVIAGAFDGVNGPALPSPWIWRVGVAGSDVLVGVSCPSDVNNDFNVDILDFLDFFDAFGTCENQPAPCGTTISADYNGDTFVDILDFLDFFDSFGSGC